MTNVQGLGDKIDTNTDMLLKELRESIVRKDADIAQLGLTIDSHKEELKRLKTSL